MASRHQFQNYVEDGMNCKRVCVGALLVLVCGAPVLAQDQANEIRCGSGTACKANFVPKFTTNGGSAMVNDSIMSQSGTTIKVAGSETVSGGISAGGTVSGGSISTGGSLTASGSVSAGHNITGAFVEGNASSGPGVEGITASGESAVFGQNNTVGGFGVQGLDSASLGIGVAGSSNSFGSIAHGIIGSVPVGVIGDSTSGYGVAATSDASNALIVGNGGTSDAVVIFANGGGAPIFAQGTGGSLFLDGNGNLSVSGAISAGTKDFKIDHPLDPANKYLYHASVESSEMMNIYTGTVLMDLGGSAIVSLPDWFEAVNGDFRYQLTAIGAPAPNLHIAREISNHQFVIAGGQSGMKVSWQVTGVRHDAYAKAHPLRVSVRKPSAERGYYLHPELYGATIERSLASAHLAQVMQQGK
jgi:hypothetical protein